jgi:uncharacterized OB-fold protein
VTVAERRPNRVLGPAHDDFWAWCDRGEFRLQRCDACGHLSWPPSSSCEKCGSSELSWQAASGNGRVVSWCTFQRPYYGELGVPWTTILVELAEGPLFISNPVGFDYDDISFGMPVRVSFIDCEDAVGPFRLPVFERA